MPKLNLISLLFFFFLTQFSYARILTQTQTHKNHPKIKFLMQNVLNVTQKNPIPNPKSPQIPFSKPRGFFPPKKGIPLPPSFEVSSNYYNNLIGMSFMPKEAPQELEMGSVTEIDEHLFEASYGSLLIVGKAQGMFVGSSENYGSRSHMVAFTVSFGYGFRDGLRLFGVYKREMESHIAVIGGIGKYEGANGYAVVKPIDTAPDGDFTKKLLLFNVYLS